MKTRQFRNLPVNLIFLYLVSNLRASFWLINCFFISFISRVFLALISFERLGRSSNLQMSLSCFFSAGLRCPLLLMLFLWNSPSFSLFRLSFLSCFSPLNFFCFFGLISSSSDANSEGSDKSLLTSLSLSSLFYFLYFILKIIINSKFKMKKIESYQSLKDDSDRYAITAQYAKQ